MDSPTTRRLPIESQTFRTAAISIAPRHLSAGGQALGAAVLRLRRTRTRWLELTKRIRSQSRTASARGIGGTLTPDHGDTGPHSFNKKNPSHSEKIS
jgi:hypothetical protein